MEKIITGEQNIHILCMLVSLLYVLLCKLRERNLTGDKSYLKIFSETQSICLPNFQGFLGDIFYTENVCLSLSEGLSGSWSETFLERNEPWWWPLISVIPDSILSTHVAWLSSIFKHWDRSFWLWGGGDRWTNRHIGEKRPHIEAFRPS